MHDLYSWTAEQVNQWPFWMTWGGFYEISFGQKIYGYIIFIVYIIIYKYQTKNMSNWNPQLAFGSTEKPITHYLNITWHL
jgi:hypothetical protein